MSVWLSLFRPKAVWHWGTWRQLVAATRPSSSPIIQHGQQTTVERRPSSRSVVVMCQLILPHHADADSAITATCKMYERWKLACRKNNAALCCLMHPKCWAIPALLLNTRVRWLKHAEMQTMQPSGFNDCSESSITAQRPSITQVLVRVKHLNFVCKSQPFFRAAF